MQGLPRAAAVFACVLLAGCSGSGEGLNENGRPFDEAALTGELDPTIESIQDHVFTPRCATCHRNNHFTGLDLEDAEESYANLVDQPASENPSIDRVEPGDPDNSYLIQKLEGTAPGNRMPLNQPPLSPETIAVIRQWISDGAPPPGTAKSEPLFMPATNE